MKQAGIEHSFPMQIGGLNLYLRQLVVPALIGSTGNAVEVPTGIFGVKVQASILYTD